MTESFDAKAGDWDENPERHQRARDVAAAIKATGLTPESALEFGCGTGLLTFALRPFAKHTVLADTSAGMIEVLTKKIAAAGADDLVPLHLGEGGDALAGMAFDTLYTLLTLHHMDETADALARFKALLNPGGTLFIGDLDEEDGSFHGEGFTGHCGFNRADLSAQLEAAGFTDVTFQTCHAIRKEVNGHPADFPLFLATAKG